MYTYGLIWNLGTHLELKDSFELIALAVETYGLIWNLGTHLELKDSFGLILAVEIYGLIWTHMDVHEVHVMSSYGLIYKYMELIKSFGLTWTPINQGQMCYRHMDQMPYTICRQTGTNKHNFRQETNKQIFPHFQATQPNFPFPRIQTTRPNYGSSVPTPQPRPSKEPHHKKPETSLLAPASAGKEKLKKNS